MRILGTPIGSKLFNKLPTITLVAFCFALLCNPTTAGNNAYFNQFSKQLPTRRNWELRGGSTPFRSPARPRGFPGQRQSNEEVLTNSIKKDQDDVSTREIIDDFLTRDSRNSFIARVYAILSVQLVITAFSCILFGMNPILAELALVEPLWSSIPLVGVLASTVAWVRVSVSPEARRRAPNKWWWLGLFTLGEAISVGFISSFYKLQSVIMAMGATAVASITISSYTILQTNPSRDLSQWGASLYSWTMILLAYLAIGVCQNIGILPPRMLPYSDMAFSALASCLFSAYLAYHTKLIVAGKHSKYRMNEKDYVYGAMALYSDIVAIFLHILELMGDRKEKKR